MTNLRDDVKDATAELKVLTDAQVYINNIALRVPKQIISVGQAVASLPSACEELTMIHRTTNLLTVSPVISHRSDGIDEEN